MNNKIIKIIGILTLVIVLGLATVVLTGLFSIPSNEGKQENQGGLEEKLHPLSIEYMRQQSYPGSDITIEQTLPTGSNYNQYIASYKSDGLKIYALLTVPQGEKPKSGWPVIIFNHGFISPTEYRTTERYVAYVDSLARNGYIVFKSDYRGHGNSEGKAGGGYGSNTYTIDVLNALSSIKKYKDADPERIGMWGHSMGGNITLRSMVVSKDIKAGVIWAGVVGSYADLINNWGMRAQWVQHTTGWRQTFINQYGTPTQNPNFWNSISANSYIKDISGPLQLHHTKEDSHVPFSFSEKLNDQLKNANKLVEFYSYEGDDHNLTNGFNIAMERTISFFDKYVKGGEEN